MRYLFIFIFLLINSAIFPQRKLKIELPVDSFYLASIEDNNYYLLYENKEFLFYRQEKSSKKVQLSMDTCLLVDFKKGQLESVKFIYKGNICGYVYEFYRRNKLSYIGHYDINGVKQGKEYYLNKNGNVWWEKNYLDGMYHGQIKEYFYGGGKLLAVTTYNYGVKEGRETSYFRSGKISVITQFHNNQPDGIQKRYTRCGKVKFYDYYVYGNFIKTVKN